MNPKIVDDHVLPEGVSRGKRNDTPSPGRSIGGQASSGGRATDVGYVLGARVGPTGCGGGTSQLCTQALAKGDGHRWLPAFRHTRNGSAPVRSWPRSGHQVRIPLMTVKTAPPRARPMARRRARLVVDVPRQDLPADQADGERAERDDQRSGADVGQPALGGERGEVDEDRVELERRDELAVLPGGAHRIQHDGRAADAGGHVHEAARPTRDHGAARPRRTLARSLSTTAAARRSGEADDDHEGRGRTFSRPRRRRESRQGRHDEQQGLAPLGVTPQGHEDDAAHDQPEEVRQDDTLEGPGDEDEQRCAQTRAKPTPVTRWVRAPATTPSGSSTSSVVMSVGPLRVVFGSETERQVADVLELLEAHGRPSRPSPDCLTPPMGRRRPRAARC